jgi:hypothetical protein
VLCIDKFYRNATWHGYDTRQKSHVSVKNTFSWPALTNYCRYLVGVPLIPLTFGIILLLPLPDTPKHLLLSKNDRKQSIKSLSFYHGSNDESTQQIIDLMLLEAAKDDDKISSIGRKHQKASIKVNIYLISINQLSISINQLSIKVYITLKIK